MTKARRPLTFEDALTRAAAELGWAKVAEILGKGERAARNLGDPDVAPAAGVGISLNQGLALDVAVRAAGGSYGPFHHCYTTSVDALLLQACADCVAIAHAAANSAKEAGEAICAAMKAAVPGAGHADRAIAERQIEEAIASFTATLVTIRAGNGAGATSPAASRAPEVAPLAAGAAAPGG